METTQSKPEKKGTFSQYVSYWGYKAFCAILRMTNVKMVALFGRLVGYAVWATSSRRRRIVARNFRIILSPTLRKQQLSSMVRRNIIRTSMNLACALKTGLMTNKEMAKSIRIEGADHFEKSGSNGHCVISCIPHAGNWEILARIRPHFEKVEHYASMYRRLSNPLLEDLVYKSRTKYGCEMYSKEEGLRRVFKLARTGGLLGVLSDQFTNEGLLLPYFGKLTGVTPLPALLYKRCKGKGHLFSVFTRNTQLGKWDAVLGREIHLPEGCESLAAITMQVNLALEKCQMENILDGLWMHHRWKSTLVFAPEQDPEVVEIAKQHIKLPFRIIVVTPESFEEAILLPPVIHILKNARFDVQITVVSPKEQQQFWANLPNVTYTASYDEKVSAFDQLESDEIYKDGPFDMVFMFSESKKLYKNLKQLSPVLFVGSSANSLKKDRRNFKTPEVHDHTNLEISPHKQIANIQLLKYVCGLNIALPKYKYNELGNNEDTTTYISPFSTLGSADSWAEDKWQELVDKLPEKPVLLALNQDKDKAEAMATRLGIKNNCVSPEEISKILGSKSKLIAVDGLLPGLAAHYGCSCTVIMASRPKEVYGLLGKQHKILTQHTPCHPCYRSSCDMGKEHCADAINVDDVLKA